MGILSEELEETLNDTFRNAHIRRNEFVTVEHLLLGLSARNSSRGWMPCITRISGCIASPAHGAPIMPTAR